MASGSCVRELKLHHLEQKLLSYIGLQVRSPYSVEIQ